MKKLCLAVLLGLTAAAGVAGAEEAAVSPAPETVTIQGEVLAYEGGTMYLVGNDETIVRTDLGRKGGRLLRHTPFTVTGTMEADETGTYLKMESVDYADPDPLAEYASARKAEAGAAAANAAESQAAGRDAAYFHGAAASASPSYFVSGNTELDREAYSECSAADIPAMEAGAKVRFSGRAVRTVVPDRVMLFWDTEGTPVKVIMNGAYIPLGQRGTLYGTVQKQDEANVVVLDLVESING